MTLPEPLRNITTAANPIEHFAHTNVKKGQDTETTDWSNGKVGAFGISAAGVAFNMLAPPRPPYRDHGDLIARASILLAASSLTNRSPSESHLSLRPTRRQIFAAWHVVTDRCEASAPDIGWLRVLTQSRKLR